MSQGFIMSQLHMKDFSCFSYKIQIREKCLFEDIFSLLDYIEMTLLTTIGLCCYVFSDLGKGSKKYKKNIGNFPNRGWGVLRGVNFQLKNK